MKDKYGQFQLEYIGLEAGDKKLNEIAHTGVTLKCVVSCRRSDNRAPSRPDGSLI